MLHGKCGGNPTLPCMEKDKYGNPRCKRQFPREKNPHTRMHLDGYPLYRLRFRHAVIKGGGGGGVIYNDGDCVPYSPYLSARYNAHINVEAVTTIGAIKNLFKSVYKGPDRAVARVERAANGEGAREEEPVRHEISEFVEGRYIRDRARLRKGKMQIVGRQPAPSRLEERGSQVNVTSTYSHSEKDNTGNLVDEERNPMSNFWVAVCIIA
ncbi:BZ3501_MvSof-1269-A2-R1_Chr12-3g03610 [Microbotryum saponariae]|nr:BZ3501_MvSof-1269-A2-R1_Chr12-3g03610 [Microbotryum saponariae]